MLQTSNYILYGYFGIMIIGILTKSNVMFTNTHKQLSKYNFCSDTVM